MFRRAFRVNLHANISASFGHSVDLPAFDVKRLVL
jgi:hypothetical protein